SPIDAELQVRTPYSDPSMKGMINAKVVLENLKNAIPLDKGDQLSGTIIADVAMEGRMSAIEQEKYDDFKADGQVIIQNLIYQSDSLGYDVDIDKAYLNFSPQELELSNLVATIGESDFKANGAFSNYIAYMLKDEMIKGAFDLTADNINLNQFMDEPEEGSSTASDEERTTSEEEPMGVMILPSNIDFTLRSQIGKLLYDDIEIKNLNGRIDLQDEVASMKDVNMEVLDGTVLANGSYSSKNAEPKIDMMFNIKEMSIKQASDKFYSIEKMAPIAKSCQGKFSTEMKMVSALNDNMEPVLETLGGFGRLQIEDVLVEKFEPLNKLASELKIAKLAQQRF
ncbi:MAG: AsmA-like C-terminal region-containing protein, partial [Flavobacteriales bacterium]